MSTYKRGKLWWYSFWLRGERVQCGTKSTSRRAAQKLEALHKARLIKGEPDQDAAQENPKFPDFGDRYLEFSKANKRAFGVEKFYVRVTLTSFFGSHRLDQITPLIVEEYKQKRLKDGLRKSSINREIGLLKSMLSKAVEWELVKRNGARDCKLFKLDDEPQSTRVLSRDEEVKLMAACDGPEVKRRAPSLKPIVLVALYTGLRRGEILRLRWADIDFENGVLIVRQAKTAAGQGRRVNINSLLRGALLALREGTQSEWLFPSPERFQRPTESERHLMDVKNAFHRAVKVAGIPHLTFHQLRHTFCTRLADAGVPLPVIQDLAGHASIIMTRRYTHPASELKERAVELLLAGFKETETVGEGEGGTPAGARAVPSATEKGKVIQFKRVAVGPGGEGKVVESVP